MKYRQGNLLFLAENGLFDVIGHGCNCFHAFGAGIAKEIKMIYPEAYKADLTTQYGDLSKLGTYSVAKSEDLTILNMYTQFRTAKYRGDLVIDYEALKQALKLIKKDYTGHRLGFPKIGCGLAGGEWSIVEKIFEECLGDEDVTIVNL